MSQVLFLRYIFLFLIYYFSAYVSVADFNNVAYVVPDNEYSGNNDNTNDDDSYLSFQKHFDNIPDEEMMVIGGNDKSDDSSQYKFNLKSATFYRLKYTPNTFKIISYKKIEKLDTIPLDINKIYFPIDVFIQKNNIINYDIDLKSGYDEFSFLKRDFENMNIYLTKNPFLHFTISSSKITPSAIEMQYYFNIFDKFYCNIVFDFHSLPLRNAIVLGYKEGNNDQEDIINKGTDQEAVKFYYLSNYFYSGWSFYMNGIYTSADSKFSTFYHMSFFYFPVREVGGINSKDSNIKLSKDSYNIDSHDDVRSLHMQHNVLFYSQFVLNPGIFYFQINHTSENNEVSITPINYDKNSNIPQDVVEKCNFIQDVTKKFCHIDDIGLAANCQYFANSKYFIHKYIEVGLKGTQIMGFVRFNFKHYVLEETQDKDLSHYFLDYILNSKISKFMQSLSSLVFDLLQSINNTVSKRAKSQKEDYYKELLFWIKAKYTVMDIDFKLLTDIDPNWQLYWNINIKYTFNKYINLFVGYLCRKVDLFHQKCCDPGINLKKQYEVPIYVVFNNCKISDSVSFNASLSYLIKINGIYNVAFDIIDIKNNNVNHIGNVVVQQNNDLISKMAINLGLPIQCNNNLYITPNMSILKKFVNFFNTTNMNNNERIDNVPLLDINVKCEYKKIDFDCKHSTTYGTVIHFITKYKPDMYDIISQQFYNQPNNADAVQSSLLPYIDIFIRYQYEDLSIKLIFNNILSTLIRYSQIKSPYYAQSNDIFNLIIQYKLD